MITLFIITYNEELILQFTINHYRTRFPNCRIILFDNFSTDNTIKIAKDNNCEIILFDTNNQINENKYLEIKNNFWKSAKTDWVLICDADELLDINEQSLLEEQQFGATIIKPEAFNMVNLQDNLDYANIKHGVRCQDYDKLYLFNKKFINQVNYLPGCHIANPKGTLKVSNNTYKLYHYSYVNIEVMINKYSSYSKRLSPTNLINSWGLHYMQTSSQIEETFKDMRNLAIKVRDD